MCTRQSRKVIWDMIDTLFLTTVTVELPLLLSFSTRKHIFMAFRANSFKFLWRTVNSKPPTMPFRIVACSFSDNLSRNSCMFPSGHAYKLLICLGAILNFQWMTSSAERSYTWPKWLPKMKALLALILQCVHIKRKVFTLYQEEYFLYTMSLWACYRNFTAFVQRYSWIDDIEGKRQLIKLPKKCELKFWLNRRGLRQQTQA